MRRALPASVAAVILIVLSLGTIELARHVREADSDRNTGRGRTRTQIESLGADPAERPTHATNAPETNFGRWTSQRMKAADRLARLGPDGITAPRRAATHP